MEKILIIDDDEFLLDSTAIMLEIDGFTVITAQNGKTGVSKAIEELPDLILCDISMPDLDGYAVLDLIRSHKETNTIPFVFITAYTEHHNMRTGMEKGADDFIVKPYSKNQLLNAIYAQRSKKKKIKDQLDEKVEEVGRNVLYSLPHEFRTVLNQIIGSAKYLNKHTDSFDKDSIAEVSDDIMISAKRLMDITENYLAYIRVESTATDKVKRSMLRNSRTDEPGATLVDLVYHLAEKEKRYEDVVINSCVDEISIEMSSDSYYKIITELLKNAFKFSKQGQKIVISMDIDEDFIQLAIKDFGQGMSQKQINSIGAYQQFERNIYEQQGVGLGLIISKRLVELHDGTFKIESEIDRGTKVLFKLPLAPKQS